MCVCVQTHQDHTRYLYTMYQVKPMVHRYQGQWRADQATSMAMARDYGFASDGDSDCYAPLCE